MHCQRSSNVETAASSSHLHQNVNTLTTRIIWTVLFIEMPTYRSQSSTFLSYKHHNTAKGLVGIYPNGAITFVSDLYAGRFSYRKITIDNGIYD